MTKRVFGHQIYFIFIESTKIKIGEFSLQIRMENIKMCVYILKFGVFLQIEKFDKLFTKL